jgi:hypothetical integral membrane protein (TIGR02206 family)
MLYFDFINPYLWYITIIILYFTSVFFIFLRKDFITRNQNYIRVFIMVLLIWSQLARYGFSIIRDGFNPEIYFPFFICRISSLVLTYYFITKDRKVESFLFYWGILGVAGVLYPNGPISNIANLTETFYIDHVLLALTPFYLVVIEGFKPNKTNLRQTTLLMMILLLLFIPINEYFGTDYFYTKDQSVFRVLFPKISDTIFGVNIHLSSILYVIAHTLCAYCFFNLEYRLLHRYKTEV